MQEVTLKQFCELEGFGKGMKFAGGTLSDLALYCGVSISYISKLYNGHSIKYSRRKGEAWDKVETFLNKWGYTLISANNTDEIASRVIRENERLKKENEIKTKRIEVLEKQVENFKQIVRIAKGICETDKEIRNGEKPKKRRVR